MSANNIMALAAKVSREALYDYEKGLENLTANLKTANTKAETLIEAAQAVCGHEYVTTENWTEDGAYPNEPRSRFDCTICKKQGVM